jgi:diacylglycerol kinase family enzyme
VLTEAMEIDLRKKRIRVATDGEVTVMLTPLRYRIRAGALHVIVPAVAAT